MSIVLTEVESIHGDAAEKRMVFYRCQDHLSEWHSFGPVITTDPSYTPADHFAEIAVKVANKLAEEEYRALVGI